ncbi:hypothetical protein [Vagococcus fluvialis]|uniref:hypothetical protein n=1 Tax=Vagococcus fluvialis TaxID=2738 RepID=UPI0037B442DD
MEDYEVVLINLHRKMYNKTFVPQWIKELSIIQKCSSGVSILSYAAIIILLMSLLFSQENFQKIAIIICIFLFVIGLIIFVISTVIEYKKIGTVQKIRRKKYDKVKKFSFVLSEYGYHKKEIDFVIDVLKDKNEKIRKKKEREHDVFFKYLVTFLLSVIIFISKELLGIIKQSLKTDVYIFILLVTLFTFFMFGFVAYVIFLSRIANKDYKKTYSEELVEALADVQLFRCNVKMVKEVEIVSKESTMCLIEDLYN